MANNERVMGTPDPMHTYKKVDGPLLPQVALEQESGLKTAEDAKAALSASHAEAEQAPKPRETDSHGWTAEDNWRYDHPGMM